MVEFSGKWLEPDDGSVDLSLQNTTTIRDKERHSCMREAIYWVFNNSLQVSAHLFALINKLSVKFLKVEHLEWFCGEWMLCFVRPQRNSSRVQSVVLSNFCWRIYRVLQR